MADSIDPVITALQAALENSPHDIALNTAAAQYLINKGEHLQALEYLKQILADKPAHIDTLKLALECANSVGHHELSTSYKHLLIALGAYTENTAGKPAVSDAQTDAIPQAQPQRQAGAKLRLINSSATDSEDSNTDIELESSDLSLADVAGMADVKKRLNRAFLAPLRNPELIEMYGKTLKGGLMLYGPPGCGKSYIARALAGEIGARFVSVGLTDVLDMYIGQSEQKLHALFESARRNAPTVLFFDELDAIGQKRSQLKHSGMRSMVNQLLTEMDGTQSNNDNVFVMGATNHPWDVDSALRRPGRFDRIVAVFPPDAEARQQIFEHHLNGKPTQGINIPSLVNKTQGFSGADIKHICDTAAESAIENAINSGKVTPISQMDLERALREIKPSTREWFETARNFATFSNQSGAYDDLLAYMREHNL